MKNCITHCIIFTGVLLFAGCKKKVNQPPQPGQDSPVMTTFVIEQKNNPRLLSDITFEIKGDTIYGKLHKANYNVIPTFTSTNDSKVFINNEEQNSSTSPVNFQINTTYTVSKADGAKRNYYVKINWNDSLPHIRINTHGGVAISSKDNYVQANISIDGINLYSNYSGTTQIKGRGNSTWTYPKKPYRLKLDTKASLFGLSSEKDWVLLANYLDETHLLNSIAFFAGQKLKIPYTNNAIPVELTINDKYVGLYLFTEQIEAETNRVNIGNGGVLLELDDYYDEDWKFKSTNYNLPVMVKAPDLTSNSELNTIKNSFQQMENLVSAATFPNNNYRDYIDAESIVNYLIVFMLTDNEEMNHPKSIYMNKTATGKYFMGPLWDFDWAYGYEGSAGKHFSRYNTFFWTGTKAADGTRFFSRFLSDPVITQLLKQKWAAFTTSYSNELIQFINDQAYIVENARNRDYVLWKRGNTNYLTDIGLLKTWINNRISYLTGYINGL